MKLLNEISALESCVVSIGTIETNSTWNIIPDKFQITGSVRTYNDKICDMVFTRLPEIAENICKAYRCSFKWNRIKCVISVVNNTDISTKMVQVANYIFGEGKGILSDTPLTCSEDIGYFMQVVPGAIGFLGVQKTDGENFPIHNPQYALNIDSLMNGVLFHINMACSYLEENK